jgi:hypothetical protein
MNNILVKEQYGFRSYSSTKNASYKLIDDILTAMNNKLYVAGMFCDLQKPFNCVNYKILLDKLKFCGIVGKFYSLIKSYLNTVFQNIVVDSTNIKQNISSNWEEVKNGVSQGSVLGPFLFILYINDLPKVASRNTSITLYADDTSVLVTHYDNADFKIAMNKIFLDINEWFKCNLLSLNCNKTFTLEFKTRNDKVVDTIILSLILRA